MVDESHLPHNSSKELHFTFGTDALMDSQTNTKHFLFITQDFTQQIRENFIQMVPVTLDKQDVTETGVSGGVARTTVRRWF